SSCTPALLSVFAFLPPPSSPLFPYTTLFRSRHGPRRRGSSRRSPADGDSVRRLRPAARAAARVVDRPGARTASCASRAPTGCRRSEEHTSELQSRENLVCRLLLEKKKKKIIL